MSFVSENNFIINIFSNCGEKLLRASDNVLGLASIRLFIFRYVICLFDLIFTLIKDLTASLVCLEYVLYSLLKNFAVLWFVNYSKLIYHAFVSFKF